MPKLSAMYCKRHDEAGTRGWQVQAPGQPSEFFADSKHGGKAAAFRRARQRARELIRAAMESAPRQLRKAA